MNNTYEIKGNCEHCGFAYKGIIPAIDGAFAPIACPKCGKQTENFDEASIIDENDKTEHYGLDYKESKFKVLA